MQYTYSFIHSGNFYSASSSPLLLKGTPDTARIPCRSCWSFRREAPQATASEELSQGPYVAAIAGIEPTTLWTIGVSRVHCPNELGDGRMHTLIPPLHPSPPLLLRLRMVLEHHGFQCGHQLYQYRNS